MVRTPPSSPSAPRRSRSLLVAGALLLAHGSGGAGHPGPQHAAETNARVPLERHNVLVLVADDLGVDMLAAYGEGADVPPTPRLDALAASGVLFRNAWSQPVCSSTRASIQTGRHGFRTTVGHVIDVTYDEHGLPLEEITLPEMLDLGTGGAYAHAAFGKWHLGTPSVGGDLAPNLAGYSHFAGSLGGEVLSYRGWRKVVDGTPDWVTDYATSDTVDDAASWIAAQTRPWLCYVAFQAPHSPFHAPPAALHTQSLPGGGDPKKGCYDSTGEDPRPYYKAMIEALDTEIGRLLDGMTPATRARTTILFLGDNGTPSCITVPPFLADRAKGSLYEGGVNVPFLVSGSAVRMHGECDALVTTTDVFATVADLARVDPDWAPEGHGLDSVSLVPYLAAPQRTSLRTWAFAESFLPNGPGSPQAFPPCPETPVCQPDLGLAGSGALALSVCGEPLYGLGGGHVVPVALEGAPPLAPAWLLVGAENRTFDPLLGLTLAPSPPQLVLPFSTDAGGSFATTLWLSGAGDVLQAVVEDAAQPSGFDASNAVGADLLATNMRAVRDGRYKLIVTHPCREELYDLEADPWEQSNLLAGTLNAEQAAAYSFLAGVLDSLQ